MERAHAYMGATIPASFSKDPSDRGYQLVVVGVQLAGCDLHACAKRQPWPRLGVGRMQAAFANNQAWGNELLGLAVIGPTLVEGCVALNLGPE